MNQPPSLLEIRLDMAMRILWDVGLIAVIVVAVIGIVQLMGDWRRLRRRRPPWRNK